MSKAAKFKVYTTRVKPVVVYECSMAHDRGGYEKDRRKLKRIHGPVVQQGLCRTATNQELREPHKELDTVADIKKKRSLERKGHLARMHLGRVVKKIHESKPGGRMARPRLRWMEAAEEGIRGMKVKS